MNDTLTLTILIIAVIGLGKAIFSFGSKKDKIEFKKDIK